jgi:hypothetical protein
MKNYIRYGVSKKKRLLADASKAYDGIVFPGNIFLYQKVASPGVVIFLKKPFFIDPMSYLFGEDFEIFKKGIEGEFPKRFRPSFEKLLMGHSLDPKVLVNLNYNQIRKEFLNNDDFFHKFINSCIDFQKNRTSEAIKEASKLNPDIIKDVQHLLFPESLIPPYFFMHQSNYTDSFSLNKKILEFCLRNFPEENFSPMVYINKIVLNESKKIDELISFYSAFRFKGFILWIDDFSESTDANKESIQAIAKLVYRLSRTGADITFLHAGYFGMLFNYFGATGICHGLGYGEVRSGTKTAKGGGPPPVRYYIKDLHTFLTLDRSLELLRAKPELICDCPICKKVIGNDPENVTNYAGEDDLADLHYLYVRAKEKDFINSRNIEDAIEDLDFTLKLYNDLDKVTRKATDRKGKTYEEQIVSSAYLSIWKDSLTEASKELLGNNIGSP